MLTDRVRNNVKMGLLQTVISFTALAERSNLSLNTVKKFVEGDDEITLADAEKLALALEFDIDTFFGTDITIRYQDLGAKNLKSFDYKNVQSQYMKKYKISESDWEHILD